MVAASPSNWFRMVPMVWFRRPQSDEVEAFILHPVDWFATAYRMFKAIERWRATHSSAEGTTVEGFNRIEGKPFPKIPIAAVLPALGISVGVTLVAAIAIVLILHKEWWFVGFALVNTACAQIFMYLPALVYRPPSPPAEAVSGAKPE
jgi:hypothetical protein